MNALLEPNFQGINNLFALAFEKDSQRTSNKGYYLQNVEIKDYDFMIDGKNLFAQPIRNYKITYKNRKTVTGRGDDYKTGCLLDYAYFKGIYYCNRFK